MNIKALLQRLEAIILHKTIFRSRTGAIDFYGVKDDDAPKTLDGQVIVFDKRLQRRCVYHYRFENRYMVTEPVGKRVFAVFQALHAIDGVRPLGLIENDRMYTPFGHYDGVPKEMRHILQEAQLA